ncbi:hypothetical protein OH491_24235 [Termitidicoccus mucosus]|uniref:Uncharacterized protein n=1 Tax=Termitidicoccus mucosus TaxID=1184151 RepID=A0A178IQV6_9BACT|nr:hypothetical protein AW736_02220 [Opitutaceae bacterium TSB47]
MKKTIQMMPGREMAGVRETPDFFKLPSPAALRPVPETPDGVALADYEFFFATPAERLKILLAGMEPGSRWAEGRVAHGFEELPEEPFQLFSGKDLIVPFFFDLNFWGHAEMRRGRWHHVPVPEEMLALLSGGEVYTGFPGAVLALPSLRGYAPQEVEAVAGTGLMRMVEAGARGGDGEARTEQRLAGWFADYEPVPSQPGAGGLFLKLQDGRLPAEAFDRDVLARVLPGLAEAWRQREALKAHPLMVEEAGGFASAPGGFALRGKKGVLLSFGYDAGSATPERLADALARTREALTRMFAPGEEDLASGLPRLVENDAAYVQDWARPVDEWDPRAFVFFLRCVNETLCRPLGLSGASGSGSSWIRGMLKAADKGRCFSPEVFFEKFPGGRDGFAGWLAGAYELAGRVLDCDWVKTQEALPRLAGFEVPEALAVDERKWLERSLGALKSNRISQEIPMRVARVEFPVFATAWRLLSGTAVRWPDLPAVARKSGEGMGMVPALLDWLGRLPVKDGLLEAFGVRLRENPEELEPPMVEWLDAHVSRLKTEMEAGLHRRADVWEMSGVMKDLVHPARDLRRLGSLAANGTFGARQFQWMARKRLMSDDRVIVPLEFKVWNPSDGPPKRVVFTRETACREVYGWFARTPGLVDKVWSDGRGLPVAGVMTPALRELAGRVRRRVAETAAYFDRFPKDGWSGPWMAHAPSVLSGIASTRRLTQAGEFDDNVPLRERTLVSLAWNLPLEPVSPGAPDVFKEDAALFNRLAGITEHNDFLEACHDAGLVPPHFAFGDFGPLDEALAARERARHFERWKNGLAPVLHRLCGAMKDLLGQAPWLFHQAPEFAALHPVSLLGVSQALAHALFAKISPPRAWLERAGNACRTLVGRNWAPDLEKARILHVLAEARAERLMSLVRKEGFLYEGLMLQNPRREPGKKGFPPPELYGLGARYYEFLRDLGAAPGLAFEACPGLPGGVTAGLRMISRLETIDLGHLTDGQKELLHSHPLFSPAYAPPEDSAMPADRLPDWKDFEDSESSEFFPGAPVSLEEAFDDLAPPVPAGLSV